jgi:hypothetical protein
MHRTSAQRRCISWYMRRKVGVVNAVVVCHVIAWWWAYNCHVIIRWLPCHWHVITLWLVWDLSCDNMWWWHHWPSGEGESIRTDPLPGMDFTWDNEIGKAVVDWLEPPSSAVVFGPHLPRSSSDSKSCDIHVIYKWLSLLILKHS